MPPKHQLQTAVAIHTEASVMKRPLGRGVLFQDYDADVYRAIRSVLGVTDTEYIDALRHVS